MESKAKMSRQESPVEIPIKTFKGDFKEEKKVFHAVRMGKNIGIFTDWDDVVKSIDGFPNPVYESFDTYSSAVCWIDSRHE